MQYFTNVFSILFLNFRINQNFIQIDHAAYIYIWFRCAIDIRLKSSRSVDKIEKHDLIFKLIISSAKCNFSFIVFANSNAMIRIVYINFNEFARFNELLQYLRKKRQQIFIFNNNFVELLIIDIKLQTIMRFFL